METNNSPASHRLPPAVAQVEGAPTAGQRPTLHEARVARAFSPRRERYELADDAPLTWKDAAAGVIIAVGVFASSYFLAALVSAFGASS